MEQQLNREDPDKISALLIQTNSYTSLPRWRYSHESLVLEFYPIPKALAARGKPDLRPIGTFSGEVRRLDDAGFIREAILKKGKRYGDLQMPFLIAVNYLGSADHDDVMEALLAKSNCKFISTKQSRGKYYILSQLEKEMALG